MWEGSVRSGKTFISIIRFMKAIQDGPPGIAMIIGVSRDSIQRNILTELCALVGAPCPTPKAGQITLLGRTIFLVGANDERAQRRIQGSTLALAYVDEMTLIPQGFFKMLLSRLSVNGAMLFGTTNPDSPFHWLKTDFLSKIDLDMQVHHFQLEDNPSLSEAYVNNLKKEYTGLWYKRYINGEWVLAEGTVYDFFDEQNHVIDLPPGQAEYYIIGVDYGTANPTTFSLIGYSKKLWPNIWLEREYYFDSKKKGHQKTDTDYVEDLIKFIGEKVVRCIYVDPSAASFKLEMMRQGLGGVIDADNDVINGIRFQSKLLSNGTYKICRCCSNAIREYQTYRWDEKASLKGEDKPIKEHDHCFVAGTPVITEYGEIPIERIEVGNKVLTRSGWNQVEETFKHEAEVSEFEVLGQKITCTPSHKFLTGQGWKQISNMINSDILFTEVGELPWLKTSNLREENTGVIQKLKDVLKGCILNVDTEVDCFIETFGSTTMEKFPKEAIFITRTTIPSTMTLAISNVYHVLNTFPIMRTALRKAKKQIEMKDGYRIKNEPQNGTEAKKGGNGTLITQMKCGVKESLSHIPAKNVERLTSPSNQDSLDFVQITVSHKQDEIATLIVRKDIVLSVDWSSKQISTVEQDFAQSPVLANPLGKREIYNIHVQNEHEYFVHKCLTHNCLDSQRYGLYTHFRGVLNNESASADMDKIYADVVGLKTDLPDFFQVNQYNQHPVPQGAPSGFYG